MYKTNQKLINRKNIRGNQGNYSLKQATVTKSEKVPLNKQQQGHFIQDIFSKPYQAQDQYADLKEVFKKANIDVAYQSVSNAFPIKAEWKQAMKQGHFQREQINMFEKQIQVNNQNTQDSGLVSQSKLILSSIHEYNIIDIPPLQFQSETDSSEQDISTSQNSHKFINQSKNNSQQQKQ